MPRRRHADLDNHRQAADRATSRRRHGFVARYGNRRTRLQTGPAPHRAPTGPVFGLEIDGQTFRASGGHLFWVAGDGWTKARNLRSGNVLHCCGGTASLNDAKEATPEPTYNIVVADFSTYFIGEGKILSHDVTLRDPSRTVVPGLPRE